MKVTKYLTIILVAVLACGCAGLSEVINPDNIVFGTIYGKVVAKADLFDGAGVILSIDNGQAVVVFSFLNPNKEIIEVGKLYLIVYGKTKFIDGQAFHTIIGVTEIK